MIVVRTRYVGEVEELYRLGASEVVPEELETSVEIFAKVLATYGVPRTLIAQEIERVRHEHYALWRESSVSVPHLDGLRQSRAGLDVGIYQITEASFMRGKTLVELDLPRAAGAVVIAHVRDGVLLANPKSDVAVESGDVLVLLGANDQIECAQRILDTGEREVG